MNCVGLLTVVTLFITSMPTIQGVAQAQRRVSKPQRSSANLSLDQQAEREAQRFWNARITKCGSDFFTRDRSYIHQFRSLRIEVRPRGITTADKLNGLEYVGISRITVGQSRTYSPKRTLYQDGGWGRWSEGFSMAMGGVGLDASLKKQKGRWSVSPSSISQSGVLTSISCSEAMDPERVEPERATSARNAAFQAMLANAGNVGIFMSENPAFPQEYFRYVYLRAKAGQLFKVKLFPGNMHAFFDYNSAIFDGNTDHYRVPEKIFQAFKKSREKMVELAIASDDKWIAIFGHYGIGGSFDFVGENIPSTLSDFLKTLYTNKYNQQIDRQWQPRLIALGPNEQWVLIYGRNNWNCYCSADIQKALEDARVIGQHILKQFIYMDDGEWLALYGERYFAHSANFPKDIINKLTELHSQQIDFDQVILAPNGSWLVGGKFAKGNDWGILR